MDIPNVAVSFVPVKEGQVILGTCSLWEEEFTAEYKKMEARQVTRQFNDIVFQSHASNRQSDGLRRIYSSTKHFRSSSSLAYYGNFTPNGQRAMYILGVLGDNEQQHDETFYVTKGTVRFHAKDGARIDAKVGDVVVIPPNAPHTFENTSEEEAAFFNVFTPAYYIQYFKLMEKWTQEGTKPDKEMVMRAQAYFATVPLEKAP